jgi:hypothetical protein
MKLITKVARTPSILLDGRLKLQKELIAARDRQASKAARAQSTKP